MSLAKAAASSPLSAAMTTGNTKETYRLRPRAQQSISNPAWFLCQSATQCCVAQEKPGGDGSSVTRSSGPWGASTRDGVAPTSIICCALEPLGLQKAERSVREPRFPSGDALIGDLRPV